MFIDINYSNRKGVGVLDKITHVVREVESLNPELCKLFDASCKLRNVSFVDVFSMYISTRTFVRSQRLIRK